MLLLYPADGDAAERDRRWAEMPEYYLVECPDLDEALRLAARLPMARYGSATVRLPRTRPRTRSRMR